MKLTHLEKILKDKEIQVKNLDEHFSHFNSKFPKGDILSFTLFLKENDILNSSHCKKILGELSVELTSLDALNTEIRLNRKPLPSLDDSSNGLSDTLKKSPHILLHQIGEGAMGSIHLAKNQVLRRTVAFKQLLEGIEFTDIDFERFLAEIQITAQLDHPYVVPIYNLENDAKGNIAYTMKVIQGQSLKDWLNDLRSQSKTIGETTHLKSRLSLFIKILDALDFAHNKGVIHRDLKPANIMLGPYNEVYIMDWGIARPFKAFYQDIPIELDNIDYLESESDQAVGTPRYMSPEQAGALNDKLDQRSDIFALGLILFELVTLNKAIQGKQTLDVLRKVIKSDLEPLEHRFGDYIAPALKSIIKKGTARRRIDRYQYVNEMSADIRRFLRDETVSAHKETGLQKLLRQVNQHRQLLVGVFLSLALIGSGTTTSIYYYKQIGLAAAENHRKQINSLLSSIANQGQIINGQLIIWEGQLQEVTAAAQVALISGSALEDSSPKTFKNSSSFGRKVNMETPVFGFTKKSVDSNYIKRKLLGLQPAFLRVFTESLKEEYLRLSSAQQMQKVRIEKGPFQKGFIGLKSGVSMQYPGVKETPYFLDSDWYLNTKNSHKMIWGKPQKSGKIILSQAIYDIKYSFLGVTALEIDTKALLPHLFLEKWPQITQFHLIDPRGRVWLSSNKKFTLGQPIFKSLPLAKKAKSHWLTKQKMGWIENETTNQLISYARVNRLGWYFVSSGKLSDVLTH